MKKNLHKIFDLRKGEKTIVFLMFLYLFLIIASLLIIKPVRNSLFLSHYGVSQLPYAFLLVAVSAAGVVQFYTKISKKFRFNKLVYFTLAISIVSLILFRFILMSGFQAGWIYYVFYIWVALFGVIVTSQFWLLANYVFNAREAKRIFGLIGAGGISGGIFGGYLAKFLAPILGTANMLFICIFFLIACIFIVKKVWHKKGRENYDEKLNYEKKRFQKYHSEKTIQLLFRSKHIAYLAAITGISVIAANLVDYQYSAIATELIQDPDQLTAFFGFWLSNLSIASLVFQVFFTSKILKVSGVAISLFFLPVGILTGTICILLQPALWSAVLVKVSDGCFKQSINKSGLELLSLPIPSSMKNKTKAFIDVFIDSLATGLGGLILILATHYFNLSVQSISIILLVLVGIWLLFIYLIKNEYLNSFRIALEKRSIDLSDQTLNINDATLFNTLTKILKGKNEKQILYGLQLLENVKNDDFIPYFKDLLKHHSKSVRLETLKILDTYDAENFSSTAREMIHNHPFEIKIAAFTYMIHHWENGQEFTLESVKNEDYEIQSAAIIAIASFINESTDAGKTINFIELFDQFLMYCKEEEHTEQEIIFLKKTISRIIGLAQVAKLYPFLENLLHDKNINIVQQAIINAGNTKDERFIPFFIEHLGTSNFRRHARKALVQNGEIALPALDKVLSDQKYNRKVLLAIPRVLSQINLQESVDLLFKHIEQKDLLLRTNIIKALTRLRAHFESLIFRPEKVDNFIVQEIESYITLYTIKNIFDDSIKNDTKNKDKLTIAHSLLCKAIKEKLHQNLDRLFLLLSLKYPPGDIANAQKALQSPNTNVSANAIEFLDNLLDNKLKKLLFPIIDQESPKLLFEQTQKHFKINLKTEKEAIRYILLGDDRWLKVCILYVLAVRNSNEPEWMLKHFIADSDKSIQETARLALKQYKNQ